VSQNFENKNLRERSSKLPKKVNKIAADAA
jgi:hypothetical protein